MEGMPFSGMAFVLQKSAAVSSETWLLLAIAARERRRAYLFFQSQLLEFLPGREPCVSQHPSLLRRTGWRRELCIWRWSRVGRVCVHAWEFRVVCVVFVVVLKANC